MRRFRAVFLFCSLLVLGSLPLAATTIGATIAPTTTCSNGVDNTPGLGLICEVTIANTITASGGAASVTVRECHGAAGDPEAACSTVTQVLTEPVTTVTQCNDATNGAGGTLRCSVQVTNTFVGVSTTETAATTNQCVGSGDGIANDCDPFPATTSGAVITQCNRSANGGTLVELRCTATGTMATAFEVTINQCNDSTNGGGALVICSANIDNVVSAGATPTPASGGGSTGPRATPPQTDTAVTAAAGSAPLPAVLALLFVVGLGSLVAVGRRRAR